MQCREKLEGYLRQAGVPFQTQHHPVAFTAQRVAQSEHVPGKLVTKVVVAFAGDRPVMLALPASYRVDLELALRAVGAESIRLAEEPEMERLFPDCEVGAMPPFGNLYDLPVYVDQALAEDDTIYFQSGTHTDTMSVKYRDFARLVEPTVTKFAFLPGKLSAA